MKVEVECALCGKEFKKYKYRVEQSDNDFCSRECANEHKKRDNYMAECPQCGEEHKVRPSDMERYERHFCSNDCYTQWQSENRVGEDHHQYKENAVLECEQCGGEFEVTPALEQEQRFCSKSCKNNWQSEAFTGEDHPCYIHGEKIGYGKKWKKVRAQALERDNYTCQACGRKESELSRGLHVHHIIPSRKFDSVEESHELDNLVCLCTSCHPKWEGIPLRPSLA